MKQVLQNLGNGTTELADVPAPAGRPNHLLIRTRVTLVSAGTERMLLAFGKANIVDKARQQPDRVRATLDKIGTDGLLPTIETVRRRLNEPLPMGYCNVGIALDVGRGSREFVVGDRVVSNGKHAEITCVPHNLCARVPQNVSDEAAAFTVIGAIALQSVRLAEPTLGETFAVLGLGLVGLLVVQLLRANGCRVVAFDPDPARVALAGDFGAEAIVLAEGADPVALAVGYARGRGIDGVIVAASTKSDEPIHQAAMMCRQRGRIVLVGVTGLALSRADFYEKELRFSVSCSYGPGRYDASYEEGGVDYPFGFVRWTAQRNFEAFLDLLDSGSIDVSPLVTHRFPLAQAEAAYGLLGGREPSLGILLDARAADDDGGASGRTIALTPALQRKPSGGSGLAFIGSGKYASAILIPAFRKAGAKLRTISSSTGLSGAHNGRKFGFAFATTDTTSLFTDPAVDAVVIATRHDLHAELACRALLAGKSVFVEKPVAISREQLAQVQSAFAASRSLGAPLLMVGFNRRFAPHVARAHALLGALREPKSFVMTVNAGAIPIEHWTQDEAVGGGRIIGEACHFIDLLRFLAGAPIESTSAQRLGRGNRFDPADKVTIDLRFTDGSIGTIHYLANGNKAYPKERLEVFCAGRIIVLSNYRDFRTFGWPREKRTRAWSQDKGQGACARAFIESLRDGVDSPIPFDEIVDVARATFEAAEQTRAER